MSYSHTVLSENFFRRFRKTFAPYLESVGIDPTVLERADIEIPEERYISLWELVGQSYPNIGLELGCQTEVDDFGPFGHALHCSPDVRKVLETAKKFIVVFAQKSRIEFECDDKTITLDYVINDPTIVYRRQDAEFGIASILRQLSLITNHAIEPVRVDFEHDKALDISVYKQYFQCPIYFNQPVNRLYFSRKALDLPVSRGNERLYRALELYLEKELEVRSIPDELLAQLNRIIVSNLHSGVPSIAEVSKQLCLSRRTLQRRLNEQDMDFSTLVEGIRKRLALAYIEDTNYSVMEVSLLLGYSESSSFSRAFRRWTGKTPHQYRTFGKT